ncbi:hypothetical protein RFI_00241 [Reticulomyxa filosa]|uniref:Uncharacterized protein n=1 Tax=Reticulomyxa filosa TaxID=46433 RepID=X6PF47_RETFI|nr:hypothetical protein RFI_00241 [Reticulomyxa filosa]|eukprot:ETO36821.1 hypothetical protein RFI_00241 [Reticulomyxa filosa]
MLGQNTPLGISSRIQSNDKADMLTTLQNMSSTGELSNASTHGIVNRYGVGNGIGYESKASIIDVSSCIQSASMQQKKIDEITFEDVWKKNMQIGDNSFDVNEQKLIQLVHNFNDEKDGQIEQKKIKIPRCDIYRKTFAAEQKKKREEVLTNPEKGQMEMNRKKNKRKNNKDQRLQNENQNKGPNIRTKFASESVYCKKDLDQRRKTLIIISSPETKFFLGKTFVKFQIYFDLVLLIWGLILLLILFFIVLRKNNTSQQNEERGTPHILAQRTLIKTNFLFYFKSKQEEIPKDKIAKECNYVKYLGLFLDSHMTYSKHVNYSYGKAARKFGYLTYLCSYKGIRPNLYIYNLLYKIIIRESRVCIAFWNGAADT